MTTQAEMQAIKEDALGGPDGAKAWNDALNALHAFAQRSGAPGGKDVLAWFDERSNAYRAALSAAICAEVTASRQASSSRPQTGETR